MLAKSRGSGNCAHRVCQIGIGCLKPFAAIIKFMELLLRLIEGLPGIKIAGRLMVSNEVLALRRLTATGVAAKALSQFLCHFPVGGFCVLCVDKKAEFSVRAGLHISSSLGGAGWSWRR